MTHAELKAQIKDLLSEHHTNELGDLLNISDTQALKIVYEIRKEGGFDPNDWESEMSGDIWVIYGKNFSAEWIDENGDYVGFDTEEEADKYIQEKIK